MERVPEQPEHHRTRRQWRNRLWLGGVLLVALVLRLYDLPGNPPGLFRDEADKGYTTYSLWQTGRDLGGRSWPLQIQSFQAFTSPLYHWFSLPLVGLGGVNMWTVRLPAALAGVLGCAMIAILGRLWHSPASGVWAALFLAISPWHLLFSRWANQGILLTLFIPAAGYLTWQALEKYQTKLRLPWLKVILAASAWALAWLAYAPARLFVPLFLAAIIAIEAVVAHPQRWIRAGLVCLIGLLALLLISPVAVDILFNWQVTQSRLQFLTAQQPLSFTGVLINYAKHWNPAYLLWAGDSNLRHHIPGQGQLTPLLALAVCAGVWGCWKERSVWRWWLLAWLVLSPIPAAITQEGLPHALRTIMVVPAWALLGGVGIATLRINWLTSKHRSAWSALVVVMVVGQVFYTSYLFWGRYPRQSALWWETGFREAIEIIETHRNEEEVCLVSGLVEYPDSHVQFVTLPPPRLVQDQQETPGYRFTPTGHNLEQAAMQAADYLLVRPHEMGSNQWFEEIAYPTEQRDLADWWRILKNRKPNRTD